MIHCSIQFMNNIFSISKLMCSLYAVTMEEVSTEISLTISISNCRFRCHGCHSAYLQQDVGKPLLPDLMTLLRRYEG